MWECLLEHRENLAVNAQCLHGRSELPDAKVLSHAKCRKKPIT